MKILEWLLNWRSKTDQSNALEVLEMNLHRALVPIAPRPQFVKTLRHDILRQMSAIEYAPESLRYPAFQMGLLVISGIMGSLVVVITGIRGLISLIGVVGLLINWLNRNSQDPCPIVPSHSQV